MRDESLVSLRRKTTLLYGLNNERGDLDVYLEEGALSYEGTTFTIHYRGDAYEGFAPLHGSTALSNIAAAFTMVCELGGSPEYVLNVVRNTSPVSNRLEVKRLQAGAQINDAYNSNPKGFRAALEVLSALPGERKIVVTPGMIELGVIQDRENEDVASFAGNHCDLFIAVGKENRASLTRGAKRGGLGFEQVLCFDTRDEALKKVAEIREEGDVVLLENDLPDLYEGEVRF